MDKSQAEDAATEPKPWEGRIEKTDVLYRSSIKKRWKKQLVKVKNVHRNKHH